MVDPSYSLFIESRSTYYPSPNSNVQAQHLSYFKFIGRMIGKAILEEILLDCYFKKSFYKLITGEYLHFNDLKDFDDDLSKNYQETLNLDAELLCATFVIVIDNFGENYEHELIENGKNIPVTNDNKHLYIEKMCHFKLYGQIQK